MSKGDKSDDILRRAAATRDSAGAFADRTQPGLDRDLARAQRAFDRESAKSDEAFNIMSDALDGDVTDEEAQAELARMGVNTDIPYMPSAPTHDPSGPAPGGKPPQRPRATSSTIADDEEFAAMMAEAEREAATKKDTTIAEDLDGIITDTQAKADEALDAAQEEADLTREDIESQTRDETPKKSNKFLDFFRNAGSWLSNAVSNLFSKKDSKESKLADSVSDLTTAADRLIQQSEREREAAIKRTKQTLRVAEEPPAVIDSRTPPRGSKEPLVMTDSRTPPRGPEEPPVMTDAKTAEKSEKQAAREAREAAKKLRQEKRARDRAARKERAEAAKKLREKERAQKRAARAARKAKPAMDKGLRVLAENRMKTAKSAIEARKAYNNARSQLKEAIKSGKDKKEIKFLGKKVLMRKKRYEDSKKTFALANKMYKTTLKARGITEAVLKEQSRAASSASVPDARRGRGRGDGPSL